MMDESRKKSPMFPKVITGFVLLMSMPHSASATSITCTKVRLVANAWHSTWTIGELACQFFSAVQKSVYVHLKITI